VAATDRKRARSFAPAHLTGVFSPETSSRDPRGRGSVGAGVVLELGVVADASWGPSGPRRLRLTSDVGGSLTISEEVARRLLAGRPGELSIHLTHQVPIGRGLGSSAAGALAVALASAAVLGRPRPRAIETAHLADLFGGGGLGGVAAILGGGLELRTVAGVPPFGRVLHRPFRSPLLVGVAGGVLPSPRILRSAKMLRRFSEAAGDLGELARRFDEPRFWDLSERFTDRAGLAPPGLRHLIRGLRRRGARAAQAMLGRTFFASLPASRRVEISHWLSGRGVRGVEISADAGGARLLPPSPVQPRSAATLFPKGPSRRRP